jgi:hypothetical protein
MHRLGAGLLATVVVAAVASAGCSSDVRADRGVDGSILTDEQRAITAGPEVVAPGGLVSVRFPDEDAVRGVAWSLAPAQGSPSDGGPFLLTAAAAGYDSPGVLSWTDDERTFGVDDIAISGVGPDVVRVPEVVEAGEWRLCNGLRSDTYCTTIEVAGEAIPSDELQVAVTTTPLAPGERFDLVFPTGLSRPSSWVLQHEEDLGRRTGFVLFPSVDFSAPSAMPADEVVLQEEPARTGPGPDVLVVPTEAEPGPWLVCAPDELDPARCASLEVSAD